MNPLLILLCVAGLSASVALWQERAIADVRSATARLSGQLLETRADLEAERAGLENTRARLRQLQRDREALRLERLAQTQASQSPLPTPQQEGWWPEQRPYFYFPKRYLSRVRLDDRIVFQSKTNSAFSSLSARDHYTWATYQPFGEDGLNPHLAVLLGLSDDEVAAVNDRYRELVRSVREVEASRLQRVDPPVADGDSGRFITARLPVLSNETQPLRERWQEAIDQTLGPGRAEVLRSQAARFFEDHLDSLGAEPREFIRQGNALWVRFSGPYGQHMGSASFDVNWSCASLGQDWEYGHLFGPGAPGESK